MWPLQPNAVWNNSIWATLIKHAGETVFQSKRALWTSNFTLHKFAQPNGTGLHFLDASGSETLLCVCEALAWNTAQTGLLWFALCFISVFQMCRSVVVDKWTFDICARHHGKTRTIHTERCLSVILGVYRGRPAMVLTHMPRRWWNINAQRRHRNQTPLVYSKLIVVAHSMYPRFIFFIKK